MSAAQASSVTKPAPDPEFDLYARDYEAGMQNPVKGLLGDSADDYVAVKLHWLLRRHPDLRAADGSVHVLDYGCGTATMLRLMAGAGVRANLVGCDVSTGMLDEATRHWPADLPRPSLHLQDGARTRLPAGRFDLALVSAVLHHVAPQERPDVYAELHRLVRPGGRLVVFEHNPVNPLTRYVVARTPIDRNAILLRAREITMALRQAGFSDVKICYLMFVPPRLRMLAQVEVALGWLPLGAQYAVTARRPDTAG